jgi:hypothetical protein
MDYERVQVPINVTVEEPRAGVVSEEPDCHIVASVADAHDVANDRVFEIVRRITSTAHYGERVSMQVNRMLLEKYHNMIKKVRARRQRLTWNTHRPANDTTWDG